jgi:exopolysaccharide biosynthesis polyprenyl glycosylphosphotransferase
MADRGIINGINSAEVATFTKLHADGVNGTGTRSSREASWNNVFYVLLDVLCVCLTAVVTFELRFRLDAALSPGARWISSPANVSVAPYLGFLLLYVAVIVLFCQSQDLYRAVRRRSTLDDVFAAIKAVLLATLLLTAFICLSGTRTVSWLVIGFSGLLNAVALAGWRSWRDGIIRQRVADGSGVRNTLIVGAGSVGQALARYLAENKQLGYAVRGFLNDQDDDSRVLGSPVELASVARAHFIEEVFITIPLEKDLVALALLEARRQRLAINLVPDFFDGLGWRMPVRYVGEFPVMELHREPVPVVGLVVKRAMDIVLSAFGLLLALPAMAATTLAVKLDSAGPVFYRSCRVGRKGRRFICYKFRTMVANADELKQELNHLNERQGPLFKISNDPRLTRPGKLLRKYSLDELPQLWNVLKGEMSLVGPRPPVPEECAEYRLEWLRRLDVKPGLTGLWQVTARQHPSFETALVLDLQYIENWNLWLDLRILLRTLPAVLSGSGA